MTYGFSICSKEVEDLETLWPRMTKKELFKQRETMALKVRHV